MMGLTISKIIKKKNHDIVVPKIKDVFKEDLTTLLTNNEKIQFMGYHRDFPYYLFCFEENIFYLKIIPNIGFGICDGIEQLNEDILITNYPNKIPNESKILKTLSKIDYPIKNTIYHIDNGLKIGHINSTYSRDDEEEGKTENSEYLLVYGDLTGVLSYNFIKGYSIINKIYSKKIFIK